MATFLGQHGSIAAVNLTQRASKEDQISTVFNGGSRSYKVIDFSFKMFVRLSICLSVWGTLEL